MRGPSPGAHSPVLPRILEKGQSPGEAKSPEQVGMGHWQAEGEARRGGETELPVTAAVEIRREM